MKKVVKSNTSTYRPYTYKNKKFSIHEYPNGDIAVQQNFGAYVETNDKEYWAKYDIKNNSALFLQNGIVKEYHLMSDIYDPTMDDDIDFIYVLTDIVEYICDHLIKLNANIVGRVMHN